MSVRHKEVHLPAQPISLMPILGNDLLYVSKVQVFVLRTIIGILANKKL